MPRAEAIPEAINIRIQELFHDMGMRSLLGKKVSAPMVRQEMLRQERKKRDPIRVPSVKHFSRQMNKVGSPLTSKPWSIGAINVPQEAIPFLMELQPISGQICMD